MFWRQNNYSPPGSHPVANFEMLGYLNHPLPPPVPAQAQASSLIRILVLSHAFQRGLRTLLSFLHHHPSFLFFPRLDCASTTTGSSHIRFLFIHDLVTHVEGTLATHLEGRNQDVTHLFSVANDVGTTEDHGVDSAHNTERIRVGAEKFFPLRLHVRFHGMSILRRNLTKISYDDVLPLDARLQDRRLHLHLLQLLPFSGGTVSEAN